MIEKNDEHTELIRKKLNELITEKKSGDKVVQKPKIQKVPASLRGQENSEKYYEPRWMSIGPIHHGNPKFQLAEKYKLAMAAKFIRDRGYESCETLYDLVKGGIPEIEECLAEEVSEAFKGRRELFRWILFLDGCAVLQFMHSYAGGDAGELRDLKMKNDQVAFTQHDLFLLENQIPFRVLTLLIESRPPDAEKLKKSVVAFIRMNTMTPPKYQRELGTKLLDRKPDHLLHLLLSVLVEKPAEKKGKSNQSNPPLVSVPPAESEGSSSRITIIPRTRLEINYDRTADSQGSSSGIHIQVPNDKHEKKNDHTEQQSFRSVTDLKAAGIDLKPSGTSSLTDVHFTYVVFAGTLHLPRLIVDDLTGSKFMNLIAYEMCPDNTETEYEVTSYISFLDSLIDYPTDVKELRLAQILHNFLGCDKEVARLFNKIGTDLVPNPKVYEDVIEKIEKHYKNRLVTWMAQFYNDHFSTPWTIMAFLAAALALGLAILDTWLNVKEKLNK